MRDSASFPLRGVLLTLLSVSVVASLGCPPASDPPADPGTESPPSAASAGDQEQAKATAEPAKLADHASTDEPLGASPSETVGADKTRRDASADSTVAAAPDAASSSAASFPSASTPDGSNPAATNPEAANQEQLFVDWDAPAAALFLTGKQNGYIEPCGCTGLANQKGGLLRRHTFYQQLVERGWPLVALDAGNQVRRFGMQPVIKFSRTVEVLAQHLGYQAIGFGPDDLRLDAIEIYQAIINHQAGDLNPFVSANVRLLGDLLPTHRVVDIGNVKIGVTSVLADDYHKEVNNPDVELIPARQGVQQVWPQLATKNCDYHVLMVFGSIELSQQLAEEFPHFDVMLTSGGDGEPTREPEEIQVGDHTTHLVLTGYKGMHVGVIGFFPGEEPQVRYQRVPLDSRFDDSDDIKTVFKAYQDQLKTLGLAGLDLQPVSHPSGATYVGSEACGDCHTIAYDIWKHGHDGEGGPHAHATKSLVDPTERVWVQRHFDPECLSCHVTGWNPQKYYPYAGGYVDLDESSYLHGNGCENCHGPGSQHYDAENGAIDVTDEQLQKLRETMRVTKEEARQRLCMECHDLDNSPDFHVDGAWEKYWPQIEHIGVD